jgi:thiol:disulfide interchange protein DsbD
LLDFYADWCVSCKEMEHNTFTEREVQTALSNTTLLQADVTANDDADRELLKHFGIFGPPTIAFYGTDGQERRNFRVVGFMKATEFAAVVRQAVAPAAKPAT